MILSMNAKKLIEYTLENESESRADENLLIALVDAMTNSKVLTVPYAEVMKNRFKYGLYSTDSITRIKREILRERPELRPSEEEVQRRRAREAEVREYYREKKNR